MKFALILCIFIHIGIQSEKIILKDESVLYGKIIERTACYISLQIHKSFSPILIERSLCRHIYKKKLSNSYIKKLLHKKNKSIYRIKKAAVLFEYFLKCKDVSKKKYVLKKMIAGNSLSAIFLFLLLSEQKEYFHLSISALKQMSKQNPYILIYNSLSLHTEININQLQRIRVLKELNKVKTITFLKDIVESGKLQSKLTAIRILSSLEGKNEHEYFLSLLENENTFVVSQVIFVLGQHGTLEMVPRIIPFLDYQDSKIVFSAHWTLKKITRKNYPATSWIWLKWWETQVK